MVGEWSRSESGSEILLRDSEGVVHPTCAIEIWKAEFQLQRSIATYIVEPPSTQINDLSFSPEVADLRLIIFTASDKFATLGIQVGGSPDALIAMPALDQLIHAGTWYCLDEEALAALREQLTDTKLSLGSKLSAAQVMSLTWRHSIQNITGERQETKFVTESGAEPTTFVNAKLYGYQVSGIKRLIALYNERIGCLLADEMGLGKTLQVIGLLSYATKDGPSLVVCPASTLANWQREISKFAPHLKTMIHQGPKRFGSAKPMNGYHVIITSYETMAQDIHFLKGIDWAATAYDEAQYLKNPSSQRRKLVDLLKSKGIVAVTGTPIENSLRDLWSITMLVAPNYLPCLEEFEALYPDERLAAEQVGQRISPVVIRRTVEEVADSLPPRIDTFVPISMTGAQARTYEHLLSSDLAVLPKIVALRGCAAQIDEKQVNPKQEYVQDICKEVIANDKKILIFASFADVIDKLSNSLKSIFPEYLISKIDGRTPVHNRQGIIDEFAASNQGAILILNPRAAGVGLNIQSANYVVHLTPEWNPAIVDQASARAHRTGQKQKVFIYYLYYEDTIEEIMIDRLNTKRDLQKSGLGAIVDNPTNEEFSRILAAHPLGDRSE